MRTFFLILDAFSIFLLTAIIPFVDEKIILGTNDVLLRNLLTLTLEYKIQLLIFCGLYVFIYTLFPKWVFPFQEKKRLKRELLKRINIELFGGDLETHRITLFKETGYLVAVILNYWNLIKHLIFYRDKWKLYLRMPEIGKYLIVDTRCGLHFEKSSTMFRIELSRPAKCNGVAGYIRYRRQSVSVLDLPDINNIDLNNLDYVNRIRKENVYDYMSKGFIVNMDILKKMHRKAMHFYGTIITERDGSIWGVLLADSVGINNNFTAEVKTRFDSFATSISDIINMEV